MCRQYTYTMVFGRLDHSDFDSDSDSVLKEALWASTPDDTSGKVSFMRL